MSVNITVNGNFVSKHCAKNPLLLDRERAKKELEEERRKKRLLQVREQSKQIAEKIRNDVKETKRKEMEKYEATKAQEFEEWRRQALQQNKHECSEAIFQLGAAHKAARAENQARAEKQAATKTQGTYKEFRKQMEARRRKNENVQKEKPSTSSKGQSSCTDCQFKCKCYTIGQEEAQKRKRNSCLYSSDSDTLSSDEETSDEETLKDTPSLTTLSPCKSPTTTTTATQTSLKQKQTKHLKQTPAVYMDVEVGSDDSVLITGPVEVKDKHAEYNRQFSSVIRVSPKKPKQKKEAQASKQVQVTSISTTTTSTTENKENSNNSNENVTIPPVMPPKEKRFTLISNLVKKQEELPKFSKEMSPTKRRTTEQQQQHGSPRKFIAMPPAPLARPPVARPISSTQPMSPPRKESISSKSSKVTSRGHTTQPPPPTTKSISTASANTVAMASTASSSCGGRVQFYDYNSKLTKEGTQSSANVEVIQQRDKVQPTAMEQAAVETRLQYDRQQDMQEKQKQMMERGQKALEREQVRRDCNDLTEKLEALTKQYPRQVPITENNPHIFADKQLRLEGKMNSAIEKLLSRPNIITCSEMDESVNKSQQQTTTKPKVSNEINLGAINTSNDAQQADDATSDSCCSILLGYVDDQSRQVRKDLEQWSDKEDSQKQRRLKNLLQRLDKLRHSIIQEIKTNKSNKTEKPATARDDNYRQLIEDISTFRQERENIILEEKEAHKEKSAVCKEKNTPKENEDKTKKTSDKKLLAEREKLLEQKEAILEEKLREFYELQKQKNKQTPKSKTEDKDKEAKSHASAEIAKDKNAENKSQENKENINCSSLETPVEIIITVQGETKCVKIPVKSNKRKTAHKKPSPTHLATLIKSPHAKVCAKKLTPKKTVSNKEPTPKAAPTLVRHNSYDSNSTSYMSLPSQIPTKLGALVDNKTQNQMSYNSSMEDTQTSTETESDGRQANKKPPPHLNPLVAQYVQRLLGMSRKTIQRLAVSSSDIETPSSSVINTSGNVSSCESLLSDEHMAFVESFVQENRSFIKELEQSMRAQNNVSLEDSMKAFDEIWRKRLKQKQNKTYPQKQLREEVKKPKPPKSPKTMRVAKTQTKELQSREVSSQTKLNEKHIAPKIKPKLPLNLEKSNETESSPEMLEKLKAKSKQRFAAKLDKAVETKLSPDVNKSESDSQIARYAQLTENCTHRIAELTELINRVREEKQRLLEVTLSSVSDNGRQSTEYLELPEGKSHRTSANNNEAESSVASSTEEATATTLKSAPSLEASGNRRQPIQLAKLDKNHPITASQDSGIADSRPITAQEHRLDFDPISQTSTESHSAMHQRKTKPPPTLRRFSPQFQEEELAHELSTILEVDTPANSRINTAASQKSVDTPANSRTTTAASQKSEEQITVARADEASLPSQQQQQDQHHQPIMFPTFEEYVQRMNLDITQLDAEQSSLLHAEFSHFIEDMQRSRLKNQKHPSPPQYIEFPSINGYLNQNKPPDVVADQTEIMEDSLAQLRISSLKPKGFPPVREYVQQKCKENPSPNGGAQQILLDTESLENITDIITNTDSDSASLDIEKELKQRKILKHSFRYTTKPKEIFSSTAHHDVGEFYQELMGFESGIEKLSTSETTTTQLETDLKRMVNQWSKENKEKPPQYQSLSSTTTSSSVAEKLGKSTSLDESSNENGRPLDLRDFLKRELMKHSNFSTSTSTSSIDDSLRSQFLHSLIGSLTPRTNAATSKSGQHTLDRQKTSTPVPGHSSQTRSTPGSGENPLNTTSSQLFSGESHISSVHGCERSKNNTAGRSNASGAGGNQSSD
ncbi:anastral spindle 1 [Musca autumnalis]|uniref:anastral spindle 1 n=1 Tax=Musca autumnalis TaxID=221902 RepID=UPI003CFA560F